LKKCEQDLLNPAFAAMNISDIALRCGIESFAHFSHRFKAAFQMSARELRRQHQGGHGQIGKILSV
jgi:AraC-like DNA-binding protein